MLFDTKYIIDKLNKKLTNNNKKISEEELLNLLKPAKDNISIITHISTKDLYAVFSELRLKLAEHMRLDNVLYLFGNGSSIYAGSKATREFKLQDYQKKYNALSSIISKISEISGIEEQLNALITVRSYYHLVQEKDTEKTIEQLINEIKNTLIENFVNSVDYHKLLLHEVFLLKLRAFGCLERTSIYTPNYDLAFEYSLDKLAIEYKNGFSGFVNRYFDPRTLQEKGQTVLIKLHGSVNWTSENGKVKEFQPKFDNGKVKIYDTAPVLMKLPSHTRDFNHELDGLFKLLLFSFSLCYTPNVVRSHRSV